jgi:hypothetical protein
MSRYKNMTDDFYYCINNGCTSSIGLVCDECYHLTFLIDDFINIRYKDKYFGTWMVSSYQNFEDYFISRAEWREQQMKSILDD